VVCPFNGSMIRRPASFHRVRRDPFPGFISTIRTLRLHRRSSRRTSLPSFGGTTVPSRDSLRPARDGSTDRPGVIWVRPPQRPRSSVESTGSPKFLGSPHDSFAVLSDPGRPASPRPLRDDCVAPASDTTEAPALCVSRLYHTAFEFAVYASPNGSLHPAQHALPVAGQALPDRLDYLQGSNRRFQILRLIPLLQAWLGANPHALLRSESPKVPPREGAMVRVTPNEGSPSRV